MYPFIKIIDVILELFSYAIIAQVVISWLIAFNVINTYQPVVRTIIEFLYKITAPVYNRIRRFVPNFGGLDLTPIIVILAIYFLRMILWHNIAPLFGVYGNA